MIYGLYTDMRDDSRECNFKDVDGCTFFFSYQYDSESVEVLRTKTKRKLHFSKHEYEVMLIGVNN